MSGKAKTINISMKGMFDNDHFEHHHINLDCDGKWIFALEKNVPHSFPAIGVITLPIAPMAHCAKCEASYFLTGFIEMMEKAIAIKLVASDKVLIPQEIRFLRLVANLTQKQVVEKIEMESDSYYSKCESGKPGFALSTDKQIRLKLLYAGIFNVDNIKDYQQISLTSGSREPTSPGTVLPFIKEVTKETVEKLTKRKIG